MDFNLEKITPDVRHLDELRGMLYDKQWENTAPNIDLYYMYRGLQKKEGLRYDITIIPANMLGLEFVKTAGHYHPGKYGEVYIVLEGEAIYLMQKKSNANEDVIEDAYAVKCKKGDVVVIPPYYGHVTINPSKNSGLKMANWVSDNFKSDYSAYKNLYGACYYYTTLGWFKNENYKSAPELRFEEPLKSLPKDLSFLN